MAPYLPPEVLLNILSFAVADGSYEQFVPVWNQARQVDRQWRSTVAYSYLNLLVRDTNKCIIRFYCGRGFSQYASRRFEVETVFGSSFEVDMVFDRLDPGDKSRAVFKAHSVLISRRRFYELDELGEDFIADLFGRWQDGLLKYINGWRYDNPPYRIGIDGVPNDTALPKLRFDREKREISFDWETMLDAFCIEGGEKLRCNQLAAEKLDAEGRAMCQIEEDRKKKLKALTEDNLKVVRRQRIKKMFKEKHGPDRDFDFEDEVFLREERHILYVLPVVIDMADRPLMLIADESDEEEEEDSEREPDDYEEGEDGEEEDSEAE